MPHGRKTKGTNNRKRQKRDDSESSSSNEGTKPLQKQQRHKQNTKKAAELLVETVDEHSSGESDESQIIETEVDALGPDNSMEFIHVKVCFITYRDAHTC